MNRKIIVTEDKSKTLLIPDLNETYHSQNGALTEAQHIFIKHGLSQLDELEKVSILELGLGTGLNLLVTLNYVQNSKQKLNYSGIEKYPLDLDTIKELGYISLFNNPSINQQYLKAHQLGWNQEHLLNESFSFTKYHSDFRDTQLKDHKYHIIYYDAFGPKVQANLWTVDILRKAYRSLKKNGILITYCAQGQFKRNLIEVGFQVESLPGPPGKREIVRAIKI